jgi:hypothetical protein
MLLTLTHRMSQPAYLPMVPKALGGLIRTAMSQCRYSAYRITN